MSSISSKVSHLAAHHRHHHQNPFGHSAGLLVVSHFRQSSWHLVAGIHALLPLVARHWRSTKHKNNVNKSGALGATENMLQASRYPSTPLWTEMSRDSLVPWQCRAAVSAREFRARLKDEALQNHVTTRTTSEVLLNDYIICR